MKDFWGGFMKKRISCKVIKSIPLSDEDFLSSHRSTSKSKHLFSYFNTFQTELGSITYTRKMAIKKEPLNDNPTEQSVDFYA